jgi:hypothetical protein
MLKEKNGKAADTSCTAWFWISSRRRRGSITSLETGQRWQHGAGHGLEWDSKQQGGDVVRARLRDGRELGTGSLEAAAG